MAAEKLFENKIKKYLEEKGCWYVKYFANSFTKSGIPDLLACIGGYFVAIEVKASAGRPSELQKHHQSMIRQAAGISIILYPEDFEDFKAFVDMLLNHKPQARWDIQYVFDRRHLKR